LEYTLSLAFLLGLFSTLHCLGMCGGIIGALTFSLPAEIRQDRGRFLVYALAYNGGRMLSYALAGALVGAVGAALFQRVSPRFGHTVLNVLAGAIMVAIGLYLAGWFPRFARLEGLGLPLWRQLEPLGRRLLPVRSPWQAVLFGAVWGWLPCGLVYSLLIWTTSAGSAAQGALYMLAFGLGTLPAAIGAGIFIGWVVRVMRTAFVRQAIGLMIVSFAVASLFIPGAAALHPHGALPVLSQAR
jgi:uncharacterized protein